MYSFTSLLPSNTCSLICNNMWNGWVIRQKCWLYSRMYFFSPCTHYSQCSGPVSGGRVTSGDTGLLKSGARLRYRHDLKCAFDVSPWQVTLGGGPCYAVDSVTGLRFWHRYYINLHLQCCLLLLVESVYFKHNFPGIEDLWEQVSGGNNSIKAKNHFLWILYIHDGIDVNIQEL